MKFTTITLAFLIILITAMSGCNIRPDIGGCESGKTECGMGFWIFKTVDVNYSDYRLGSSINENGFWSVESTTLEMRGLDKPKLHKDYFVMRGAPSYAYSPMAFYKTSLIINDSLYPENDLEKIKIWNDLADEGLIIKEPFTELYICPPMNIADPSDPKKSILERDPNYITDKLNNIIDGETLEQNCEKKI